MSAVGQLGLVARVDLTYPTHPTYETHLAWP